MPDRIDNDVALISRSACKNGSYNFKSELLKLKEVKYFKKT